MSSLRLPSFPLISLLPIYILEIHHSLSYFRGGDFQGSEGIGAGVEEPVAYGHEG